MNSIFLYGKLPMVSTSAGDADDDGDTDGHDFLTWQRQFEMGVSPLAASSQVVPEPGTLALCIALFCGSFWNPHTSRR